MSGTAVVAFSGGLDTSCIVAWLQEDPYRYDEVVAVLVDVGQELDLDESIVRANLPAFRAALSMADDPVCQRCVCSMRSGWRSMPWA